MSAPRQDAGESLVEVMMSVAILGIAFVAILGGMVTSILGTETHHQQSVATTVLLATSEALKDPDNAYVACAGLSTYSSALSSVTVPTGWASPKVTSVSYWDGVAFQSTCFDTSALGRLLRLQRLTVEVRSPNDSSVETLEVVKRDDS
jgi:type II secretory pathway pseudopilin PulG